MVGYLIKGDLDSSIRDFIRQRNAQGQPADWNSVRRYIVDNFLDQDEAEYLRKRVDQLRQEITQDVRDYSIAYDKKVKLGNAASP